MPTRRRFLHRALSPLTVTFLSGCGTVLGPDEVRISTAQLQQALSRQLPQHFSAGILEMDAQVGKLSMLPEDNRVAVEVGFEASGALLPRSYPGSFELLFGVRYMASDRSLRANRLQARKLQVPGMPTAAVGPLERALPVVARVLLGEDVVLHRLSERDGQRLAAMGRQPGDIQVTADGLLIRLVPATTN
jgi:hypothetical protein